MSEQDRLAIKRERQLLQNHLRSEPPTCRGCFWYSVCGADGFRCREYKEELK